MMLAFVLTAATLLGFGERPVADLQLVPTAASPRLASNGRGFVGVWTSWRNDNDSFLFRVSIDAAGTVVDSRPIATTLSFDDAHIASDGDRYLVALGYSQKGLLLDERGDLIREIALPKCDALASNGLGYAVVSSSSVQLLDREGEPAGGPVLVNQYIEAIAASGSGYILLTYDGNHLFVRTLSRGGTLSSAKDAGYFPTWGGDVIVPFLATVASNGSDALIAVHVNGRNFIVPIHGGDIGPSKEILPGQLNYGAGVISTGNEFIVVNWSASGTMLMHVSHDGSVISRPITIEPETGSLAWNGWRLLFAGRTTARLYAASATFPAASDAQPLARYATAQTQPRIATDGESALVMWTEPYSSLLHLSRIASDGSHLDGAGIRIERQDSAEPGAVAWDGNDWVIAYATRGGVGLRTMNRSGELSEETLLPSLTNATGVRLTSDGNGHFAVIWETANPQPLIRASIDGAPPADLTHFINAHPDVTWDSGAFRMVWMNYEHRGPDLLPPFQTPATPVGITFATMQRNGFVSVDEVTQTDSDQRPRIAGKFSMLVKDGVKIRRGADEIAKVSEMPSAFAVDDDGHALLVSPGGKAVLIGAGEPQSFAVGPADAGSPDVVWTHNGWMMVYTRVVDESPYNHVQRVFVKTIDVSPARRRP